MSLNTTINALRPGQEVRIGGDASGWITVERSGDGRTIRYVRHTPSGWAVFRTEWASACTIHRAASAAEASA